jgi:DNA-binding MarR family transcriptional regulator
MLELVDLPNERTLKELISRYPGIEIDAVAISSFLLLMSVATDIFKRRDAYFSRHDLSSGRFSVLMLLMREPSRSIAPSCLAERAGVTRATMTGLLDGLERSKLVRRVQDSKDARRSSVQLTPKGIKFIDRIMPEHVCEISRISCALSSAECKTLRTILEKLRAGIHST